MHFIWVSMYLARKFESANWGHYINVSYWRRDRHFTWSSEPREGLACCSAKGVPSFLGYFKTLSIGPAPGIEPATSRSAVKRSTDWANPAAASILSSTYLCVIDQAWDQGGMILTKFLLAFLWTVKIIKRTSSFFSASTSQEHSYIYSTNYLPFVLWDKQKQKLSKFDHLG